MQIANNWFSWRRGQFDYSKFIQNADIFWQLPPKNFQDFRKMAEGGKVRLVIRGQLPTLLVAFPPKHQIASYALLKGRGVEGCWAA